MGSRACISSDEITSGDSGATYTGHGILWGVQIISDNSKDPTVIIYDNSSAASPKLFERVLDVSAEGMGKLCTWPKGVAFKTGLYTSVGTTGASCILYYQPEA